MPKKKTSFWADPATLARLDDLAYERRISRAELLRRLMDEAIRRAERKSQQQA